MRVETLTKLCGGVLKNTPTIDFFTLITAKKENIIGGELFISQSLDESYEAIKKGAYGIVSTKSDVDFDNEVAWIEVEDLYQAKIKFIRYELIDKRVILVDEIRYEILKKITKKRDLFFLDESLLEDFDSAKLRLSVETVIAKKSKFFDDLSLIYSRFSIKNRRLPCKINSLFSIKVFDKKNSKITIPHIFFDELASCISFCKQNNIKYTLSKKILFDFCEVRYVTNSLKEVRFGKSDKIIVFANSNISYDRLMSYIESNAKHLKRVYFKNEISKDELIKVKFNIALLKQTSDNFFTSSKANKMNLFNFIK